MSVRASSTKMADILPPGHAAVATRLATAFARDGKELMLVGGIVRDMLLGLPLPADLDFATDARPLETQRLGRSSGANAVYLIGADFGTVGLVFNQQDGQPPINVEITTYRAEHYPTESRHPEVEFGDNLEEDLSRRDFTINAIAEDVLTGEIIDPFAGRADLDQGIIRAVGNPLLRFDEDPLRLLRAARFVAQLGFRVEANTQVAMIEAAGSIGRISQERIYNELTRLLTGPYASHALELLRETGLLVLSMPELGPMAREVDGQGPLQREKDLWEHTKKVVTRAPARTVVRWAALLHDAAKPLTRGFDENGEVHFIGHEREGAKLAKALLARLRADRHTQADVSRLIELHGRAESYDPSWTDSAVRRLMLDAEGVLDDLLDLAAADVTSAREFRQKAAAQRIAGLRTHIERLEQERSLAQWKSPLDGVELMQAFDRPPGRWIAVIKDHLREMVLDGDLAPEDKAAALRIAAKMIDEGAIETSS
jgi:poly(A) polymerase